MLELDASLSRIVFGFCNDETPLETHKYQIAQLQEQLQPARCLDLLPQPLAGRATSESADGRLE